MMSVYGSASCCVAGGTQPLAPGNAYFDAMSTLTDMAIHDYDQSGEIFPIHYTCLGWEAIAVKVTGDPFILSAFLPQTVHSEPFPDKGCSFCTPL
jgi:hypothetical protein